MIRYVPKRLGQSFFDKIFPTSAGRLDPRTGELVQVVAYKPVTPWERQEQEIREAEQKLQALKARRAGGISPVGVGPGDYGSSVSRMRPDFGQQMNGRRLSGYELSGESGFWDSAVPWVFLGIAAIVTLEATGVTNLNR